jgi:hypothetical protein
MDMRAQMIKHMASKENPMFPMMPLMPMVMFGLLVGNLAMTIKTYRRLEALERSYADQQQTKTPVSGAIPE